MEGHYGKVGSITEVLACCGEPVAFGKVVECGIWIFMSEKWRAMHCYLIEEFVHLLDFSDVVLTRILLLKVEDIPERCCNLNIPE